MNAPRRPLGIMLIELMVYIAVLGIVINAASSVFSRDTRRSVALARNAEDIIRTVRAGERWREDIRRATAIRREPGPSPADGDTLVLQHGQDTVRYRVREKSLWRQGSVGQRWALVLPRVRASRMVREVRHGVASWRWEVELASVGKPQVRPLFSFRAVPWAAEPGPGER